MADAAMVTVRLLTVRPSTSWLLVNVTSCEPAPVLRMNTTEPAGTVSPEAAPDRSVIEPPAVVTLSAGKSVIFETPYGVLQIPVDCRTEERPGWQVTRAKLMELQVVVVDIPTDPNHRLLDVLVHDLGPNRRSARA